MADTSFQANPGNSINLSCYDSANKSKFNPQDKDNKFIS